jgi:hypothetical protein
MSIELQPIDVTASPELLRLAEEVQRSGIGRILKHGDREIALLTPVEPAEMKSGRTRSRAQQPRERDSILNIIGIGESTEPTDIAHHKREYLADAYDVDH